MNRDEYNHNTLNPIPITPTDTLENPLCPSKIIMT